MAEGVSPVVEGPGVVVVEGGVVFGTFVVVSVGVAVDPGVIV